MFHRAFLSFLLLLVLGCSDTVETQQLDGEIRSLNSPDVASDVYIIPIPDVTVDAWVDPCVDIPNTHVRYCDCNPNCCQQQTWYCPPRGVEIQAKYAVLDICDENLQPCDRNIDPTCPPAEILEETPCQHAFDCPPGIDEEFVMYYDCDIDGVTGRQEVRCDKGRLYYGECVTCVESEEVCDNEDNDCDGQIDEGQKNACGSCGQVPEDICDGLDNDCDEAIDEELIRQCETICNAGLEVCQNGAWAGCTAQVPVDEQCDGEDNDCDNLVDEGLNCQCPPEFVGVLMPCTEPPLACGLGFKTCECVDEECQVTEMTQCFAICHWFPEVTPVGEQCDPLVGSPVDPEVCNAYDEDCDTLVDEQVTRQCYTGPEDTLGIGVCTPGEQVCNNGQWYGRSPNGDVIVDICGGEVVPAEEICDGADNDCDGITDFGEEIPETDILFIVDWSGSMENYINAVRMAMNRFAQSFEAEDRIHWGLIVGPKELPNGVEGLIKQSDISEFDLFLAAFANVGQFDNSTGSEMLKDALLLSVRSVTGNLGYDFNAARWANNIGSVPDLANFNISWRPGADKIIVVFSDEEDQSFLVPRVMDDVVLEALDGTPNLKVYVFADFDFPWRAYVNQSSGGQIFDLTSNQQQMYDDLMSILDEICLPDEEEEQAMWVPGFNASQQHGFMTVSLESTHDFTLLMCY